jgi:hypothetical protein
LIVKAEEDVAKLNRRRRIVVCRVHDQCPGLVLQ